MQTRLKFMSLFVVGTVCPLTISSATPSHQTGSGPTEQYVESPTADPLLCPTGAVLKHLDQAVRSAQAAQPLDALKAADEALATSKEKRDSAGEAVAQRARARVLSQLNRKDEATATWQAAARAWELAGDGPGQVEALGEAALLLMPEKPADSDQLFSRALALGKSEAKRPLASAKCLHALGSSAAKSRNMKDANNFLAAALTIREKLVPSSLETADTLNQLGFAVVRNDPKAAHDYFFRALTIEEQLPDSLEMADSLNGLGFVENVSGNLAAAREYFTRALTIRERLAPDSMAVASSLNSLGLVTTFQGDYAAGKEYFQRFLAISEKLEPNSRAVTIGLMNLGNVAKEEGDFTAAQDYYLRTMALQEKLFPNSDELAGMLDNLGNVARALGDLAKAKEFYAQALIIQEKLHGEADVALSLDSLAGLAMEQGELMEAERYLQRAVTIQEKVAPEGLDFAGFLNDLGSLAFRQQN
jgi:tetratricopeptide (TPR) repeat protein